MGRPGVGGGPGLCVRPIQTGRRTGRRVEITDGLSSGERYVARGAFTLKAELGKGSLSDGHAH